MSKPFMFSKSVLFALIVMAGYSSGVRADPPPGDWKLVMNEEFTKMKTLDGSMWGFGTSPNGKETVPSKSALIRPNELSLTTQGLVQKTIAGKFVGPSGAKYDYATSWSWQKRGFWMTYGYLEIKAKYPRSVPGAWPAFWMVQDGWPPEIDIAEHRGGPRNYMVNAFCYKKEGAAKETWDGGHPLVENEDKDRFTGRHTWALRWEPGELTWYCDGKEIKKHKSAYVPSTAMYVILSSGVSAKDADGTGLPLDFVVEYFRWYQHPPKEIPSAPSAVRANLANDQVALTWGAPANAQGYNIKRATTPSGPYETIATLKSAIPASYSDTKIAKGSVYYYMISAVNEFGEGKESAELSVSPVK